MLTQTRSHHLTSPQPVPYMERKTQQCFKLENQEHLKVHLIQSFSNLATFKMCGVQLPEFPSQPEVAKLKKH